MVNPSNLRSEPGPLEQAAIEMGADIMTLDGPPAFQFNPNQTAVIEATRPADRTEYAALKRELEELGYTLNIRRKRPCGR